MKLSSYINRIAQMILAEGEWVSKQEYPRPPREWGSDVHETAMGWGRGKEVKPEPQQNVPRGTNEEVVPRWKKDKDFVSKMAKQRPDLSPEKIYEELKGYPDAKSRKLALHWTLTKGIVSPEEDKQKVLRAIKVSELKKIDPMKYKSPLEITESFGHEVKEDKINPDTVKEFSNKRELPEGVTYYDVEDSKEGQLAARRILDSHFGKDSNPWCLLYKDKDSDGPSSDSWTHWHESYSGDKKIAFQNGKLIAFFGGGQWWDRLDNSTNGIPITSKLPNDRLGRKVLVEMDPETGKLGEDVVKVFKGDPNNGPYAEWYTDTKEKYGDYLLKETGTKENGIWVGKHELFHENGKNMKELEQFYRKGIPVGPFKSFWESGNPRTIGNYSDSPYLRERKVGKHETYHKNGQLERKQTLSSNGLEQPIGEYEEYFSDGKLKEKGCFDMGGKMIPVGTFEQYDDNANISNLIKYDNGEIVEKTSFIDGKRRDWSEEEIGSLNRLLKLLPMTPGLREIPRPETIIELEEMFNRYKNK